MDTELEGEIPERVNFRNIEPGSYFIEKQSKRIFLRVASMQSVSLEEGVYFSESNFVNPDGTMMDLYIVEPKEKVVFRLWSRDILSP